MSDTTPEGGPHVVGVNSEDAEGLIGALSSQTARDILDTIHREPSTPSEIADQVDTTVQNVRYHLDNLTEAELIGVEDTRYSPKGREMKVYAPSQPLVVFVGDEAESSRLREALSRGFAALLGVAAVSVAVEYLYRSTTNVPERGGDDAADGDGGAMQMEEAQEPAYEAAQEAPGLLDVVFDVASPGVLVFAGGVLGLALFAAALYVRRNR
ncbi:MAG: ArsR/SmtB family transcription factor [Halobacteriota archaeon]